jgi:hypothetical protein
MTAATRTLTVAAAALAAATQIPSLAWAQGATNICGQNATIGASVMAALNLTYPGLETVAKLASQGDLNGACEALSTYYQTATTAQWLRKGPVKPGTGLAGGYADMAVFNDTYYLQGVQLTVKIPRNPDGGLDWLYRGPFSDQEVENCINRFDVFSWTLDAWLATGNPVYPTYFDALIKDWVLHLPCPDALSTTGTPCVPLGVSGNVCSWEAETSPTAQSCKTGTMESPWRSLEMGIRMAGVWPVGFFGFQGAAEFSTSARALFVLAVAEHNAALIVDGGHPGQGTENWEIMQSTGILSSAVTFPELRNASDFVAVAFARLEDLLVQGVYPDGVETEEASGYGMGTAGDFFNALSLLALAGDSSPPASFASKVEEMWAYGAYASDPEGCLPRNGDTDVCDNGYNPAATSYFNRTDWLYIHTDGLNGTVPAQLPTQGPSSVFPWAGQVILRSGYDASSTWVWFDVGPYGSSGHGHRDKLQVHVHSRGSMLLVDSGRFSYSGTDLSATLHVEYARNSSAHNTLTIDGADQLPFPAVADEPIGNETVVLTPTYDTAYANMTYWNGLVGNALHGRGVYYQRFPGQTVGAHETAAGAPIDGDWLVVVDVIVSDRPRSVQATWHTHPNSTGLVVDYTTGVASVGGARSSDGQPTSAQACVIPAPAGPASLAWANVTVLRGQYQNTTTNPPTLWQGWFSASYDDAWPASTLVYQGSVAKSPGVFAWLIIPTSARGPCDGSSIAVTSAGNGLVNVTVSVAGQSPVDVSVPVGDIV